MSEFDAPKSRKERERVRNVQLTLRGLGAGAVKRYEQPEEGVGFTDEPTSMVFYPLDGHVEEVSFSPFHGTASEPKRPEAP